MNFTVIVPTYNREQYISETLDAILAQSYAPAEVIVVDDGSTDGTRSLVEGYGASVRLIVIPNGGAAAARHVGALAAQGDYLAFCDSDDVWKKDHLENLSVLHKHDKVDFAFTNFHHFTAKGEAAGTHFEGDKSGFWTSPGRKIAENLFIAEQPLFPHILDYQALFQSCFSMRRELYAVVGGYDASFGRMVSEDLEFALRCAKLSNIGVCTRPTVGIRRHEGNHSTDWIKCLFGSIDILRYSSQNHGLTNEWKLNIDKQIRLRSIEGINVSFASGRFQDTVRFGKNLDRSSIQFKQRLKLGIARMPRPVSQLLQKVLAR